MWIVLFYDGQSQEAANFKEEYTMMAERLYGIISVGAVDCHEDEEMCEEFSVFSSKKKVVKIFTENTYDDGIQYKGKMEWKSIAGAAQRKMQNFVSLVNKENYESFVQ